LIGSGIRICFFEETGGVCTPTEIYYQIKKSSGYSTGKLRDKEGNEKNKRKQKCYNRFWIHKSKIRETLALALGFSSFNSFLKISFAACISGCKFLKMRSFLTVQIAQHIKIATISVK